MQRPKSRAKNKLRIDGYLIGCKVLVKVTAIMKKDANPGIIKPGRPVLNNSMTPVSKVPLTQVASRSMAVSVLSTTAEPNLSVTAVRHTGDAINYMYQYIF
jgi:hypothetical protein